VIGLRLLPSLLPPECQVILLDRLFHRELSNPLHKTNLYEDYEIPFPPVGGGEGLHGPSFFSYPESSKSQIFKPLRSLSKHKPLNNSQFLRKKLRWLTIGTQYDWNTREYPTSSPTPFPEDIEKLVTALFQNSFTPESGVVLLYSPKDYMPVHRDVSEECERGLASFSLGCDGLFLISRDKNAEDDKTDEGREQDIVVIRVRSGDVVQMGGETRWAWHAMPKVMAGTCPSWLEEWPAGNGTPEEYDKWKGYMKGKRLNISCRQVWG
jgi:alkylated DNA repair protein alkB homolog 1